MAPKQSSQSPKPMYPAFGPLGSSASMNSTRIAHWQAMEGCPLWASAPPCSFCVVSEHDKHSTSADGRVKCVPVVAEQQH